MLIRAAAVTHSSDPNQREVALPIKEATGAAGEKKSLEINLTAKPDLAPPGYYMVFLSTPRACPRKPSGCTSDRRERHERHRPTAAQSSRVSSPSQTHPAFPPRPRRAAPPTRLLPREQPQPDSSSVSATAPPRAAPPHTSFLPHELLPPVDSPGAPTVGAPTSSAPATIPPPSCPAPRLAWTGLRLGARALLALLGIPRGASRPWLLLGAFLAVEFAICFMQLTGPFLDEGIYVTAGAAHPAGSRDRRQLPRLVLGLAAVAGDRGVGWNSRASPVRAAAALCVTAGMAGMAAAAGNLFGARVRAFAVLAAVTSGPVIALAHLAVYDTSAVAFAGGAFWAVTEFLRRDDRAWLVGAALLYALAGLSKYPVMAFIAPPLVLLMLTVRGRRAALDLFLFAMVAGAVLLIYFMADRAQLIGFMSFRTHENPSFGVSTAQLAYSQFYYTAVPLLLALAGAILLARRRIVTLSPSRRRRVSAGSPASPRPRRSRGRAGWPWRCSRA